MLAPRTLVTWTTDAARATPTHGAEKGGSKRYSPRLSSRFFFLPRQPSFLCMLHSKRVFKHCSARRTRALLRLKADLLGKHPSKWDSRSSALGARQARTQTSKLHTENNIRFACLASGTKNIPCLASGTKNIPFQKRSRARISSYEAARAQRTLLENFYSGTRFDTCMRLARCAHTCIQNISKSTFFF